jgi:hypothetical protein
MSSPWRELFPGAGEGYGPDATPFGALACRCPMMHALTTAIKIGVED